MARSESSAGLQLLPLVIAVAALVAFSPVAGTAQAKADVSMMPWMNQGLSPDERADMVLREMTLDEKIQLVHGDGWGVLRKGSFVEPRSNLGAGFKHGIDGVHMPDMNLAAATA